MDGPVSVDRAEVTAGRVGGRRRLRDVAGYPAFWAAGTVSDFGTPITLVAVQVLVVVDLHASATEVGVVTASRWVPYLLFGLLAGVVVDRCRRRPVLVGADVGRAVLLGLVPVFAAVGWLSVPVLAAVLVAVGALSLCHDAAHRSFLPRLVAPELLTRANARVEQSASVARTAGPALAGWLVGAVGAPVAVLVDAVSYLGSGVILARIGVDEPPGRAGDGAGSRRRLFGELREGVAWVYRHPTLAPYALTTHLWFVFNSMLVTVFVPFALRDLRVGALGLGVAYAAGGLGGVLGGAVSARVGARLGVGRAVVAAQFVFPVAFAMVALSPDGAAAWGVIAGGQFLFGLAVSSGGPIELGYQQAVTPDRLQGRMNATIRSLNRGVITLGAPAGGALAEAIGYRPALWVGVGGFTLAAGLLAVSPFRRAAMPGSR